MLKGLFTLLIYNTFYYQINSLKFRFYIAAIWLIIRSLKPLFFIFKTPMMKNTLAVDVSFHTLYLRGNKLLIICRVK